ncbi:hypothetical protein [Paenibacillus sp. OAS669]|uniref:hypothetical protein n=1 Tax=Paenibacillus sp. OAS669 TaxID=2663821 RepID=UPI0017898902|nr:hypothetical protein [Paenibacillus sp. OAS669]MBE1443558.1 hypothetical protein [Paenibacillus sp. OAS669]
MLNLIKKGLGLAWNQPFTVCTLFIYNLLWGLGLFEWIHSIVFPLLRRYPGKEQAREAVQLFWIEGQFQLTKTDLVQPYLLWGLGLLLARMLLTPVLNAGVYYSLKHTELNAGYRFVQGIRELTLPFFGYYLAQMALQLGPLYWLIPKAAQLYSKQATLYAAAQELLPWLGAYLAYMFILQTLFMYLQFGKVCGKSSLFSVSLLLRNVLPALLIAVTVTLIGLLITAAVVTSTMIWAGFLALLGFQAYRFIHMFCKMWEITAQYALWSAKSE